MKKIKYLLVYLLPASVYISFTNKGILTYTPLFLFFVLVPFLEFFLKPNASNFSEEVAAKEKNNFFYSLILYLTLPV